MVGPVSGPNRGPRKSSDRFGSRIAGIAGFFVSDPAGSATLEQTFTASLAGLHTFYLWGGGASGVASDSGTLSGGSGAYSRVTRQLEVGDVVKIVVGPTGSETKVTFPGGSIVKAGGGNGYPGTRHTPPVAAVASGGDVNINGTTESPFGAGSGCPAPSELYLPGGVGGRYRSGSSINRLRGEDGTVPGGGGGNADNTRSNNNPGSDGGVGASGLVLVGYGRLAS